MLPWELCIEISERLVSNSLSEGFVVQQDEPNWTNVRCEVCRLLERGLEAQNPLPRSLYPRV